MEKELSFIENSLKDANITAGLELLQKLLAKYKSNSSFLAMILERLYAFGQTLIKGKAYKSIFPLFQILCKLCTILQDYSRLCDIKNSLSFCYRNTGQTNLALKECLEALEIAGDTKALLSKLSALHLNACAIYREDVRDLTIAKTHAELAYFFAKENSEGGKDKEKRTLAVACYNYALVLEELKDKTNATIWYKEGLKFCEEKWNDLYMEQVFREKVNSLSLTDQLKKPILFRKRAVSQKGSSTNSKYNFIKEIEKITNRQGTARKKPKKNVKKYSLTPISNKTLPITSGHLDRSVGFSKEHEPDFRVKIRNSNTPVSAVRNLRYVSEVYKAPQKSKLSLVQSVIKIQKWYRRLKKIPTFALKFDYISLGFKVYFGVKYFVSIYKELNYKSKIQNSRFFIEAWPLISHIQKPQNFQVDLATLCELVDIACDESLLRDKENTLLYCVNISQTKIFLKKIELLHSGEQGISGENYLISIYLHDRVLEIEASSEGKKFVNTIKLDPLQDSKHVLSKVPFILENLTIKSGVLSLNLI